MRTRVIFAASCALLVVALATSAPALKVDLEEAIVSSYSFMQQSLEGIDPATLPGKRGKNLGKARNRFAGTPEDVQDLLRDIAKGAKPLARAVGGTTHEAEVQNSVIQIIITVGSMLSSLADELEERSEMGEEPEGGGTDTGAQMVLAKKPRRKVNKLIAGARQILSGGRGNDTLLAGKGKNLKRRAKALIEAAEKLAKARKKLLNAGL